MQDEPPPAAALVLLGTFFVNAAVEVKGPVRNVDVRWTVDGQDARNVQRGCAATCSSLHNGAEKHRQWTRTGRMRCLTAGSHFP